MEGEVDAGVTLLYLRLFVLLFVDNTVLINESVEELQNSLDRMYNYCQERGIIVDLDKTRIAVFEKLG